MAASGGDIWSPAGSSDKYAVLLEGAYPFQVRAAGLYPDAYPADAVPPWQTVCELTMPTDFSALEKKLGRYALMFRGMLCDIAEDDERFTVSFSR